MNEPPKGSGREPGLNPSLRQRNEDAHDTRHRTPPPVDSASVQREEGRFWPFVWAAAAIAGIVIGVWLIFL